MSDELFTYHENRDQKDHPGQALLAFTRLELKLIKSFLPEGREKTPFLGGITKVTMWPDLVLAGPILGAPQAAMVMEILYRRGVKQFYSLGLCGSLTPGLVWGDIVLPRSGLSEEGTSGHYPLENGPAAPDEELFKKLEQALFEKQYIFKSGPVWTTDAPYRETREKVGWMMENGMLAVDMETTALMTVAKFRGLAWAGLLVVSDELWGEKWRPGFSSTELKTGLIKAVEVIMAVLGKSKAGQE